MANSEELNVLSICVELLDSIDAAASIESNNSTQIDNTFNSSLFAMMDFLIK